MLGRRKGEGLGLAASGETRGQNVPDRQPCGGLRVDRPDHAMPGTALWVFLHPGFPSGFGPTPSEPSPLLASLAMEPFPATLVRRAGDRYSHDAAARLRGARDGIISGPDASGCHGSVLPQGGPLSGKQETASQRPVDPVGGPASQIGALTPFPGCHTAVPRPAAGQLIPMNRRRWVRAFDREASELELANGRHNAGSPAARSVAEAA